jgi:predicted component of type VI protein secretion system
MKFGLLVKSAGSNAGKVLRIAGPQFLIGRDPQCQLRPNSPAISKRHCALFVGKEKVVVRDLGSTNGTFVNDERIEGDVALKNGDNLKIGPLEFEVQLEVAAPAAAKAEPAAAPKPARPAARPAAKVEEDESAVGDSVQSDADGPGSDKIAALLLDGEDSPSGSFTGVGGDVPEGNTVMDMPALGTDPSMTPARPGAKQPPKPSGDTSSAAAEILKKYRQRPRS